MRASAMVGTPCSSSQSALGPLLLVSCCLDFRPHLDNYCSTTAFCHDKEKKFAFQVIISDSYDIVRCWSREHQTDCLFIDVCTVFITLRLQGREKEQI